MKKKFTFIANWKMSFNFQETLAFATDFHEDLLQLSEDIADKIIICPSSFALHSLSNIFKDSTIKIGAQDCSTHSKGAFTGQISAKSLRQIGCTASIIGHSERRGYNKETNDDVAAKYSQLLDADLSPILCIGETQAEYEKKQTLEILEQQLAPIIKLYDGHVDTTKKKPIYIAYEPVWSIGTGIIPTPEHLESIMSWLHGHLKKPLPNLSFKLVYGGSIKPENAASLKNIPLIEGFLIGGASLDFQKLKKIVLCN